MQQSVHHALHRMEATITAWVDVAVVIVTKKFDEDA